MCDRPRRPNAIDKFTGKPAVCRSWNGVDTRLVGWPNIPILVLLFSEREAAATCSEFDSDASAFIEREIVGKDFGIFQRFTCSCERERDSARNVFAIFRIDLSLPVEVGNFGGNLDGRIGRIK